MTDDGRRSDAVQTHVVTLSIYTMGHTWTDVQHDDDQAIGMPHVDNCVQLPTIDPLDVVYAEKGDQRKTGRNFEDIDEAN